MEQATEKIDDEERCKKRDGDESKGK